MLDRTKDIRIPATESERNMLQKLIVAFVAEKKLTPPVTIKQLYSLSNEFVTLKGLNASVQEWVMVFMNNALWNNIVAAIPHEKRILLLPQCLKDSSACEAPIDDFGLLCRRCGRCSINALEKKAEDLGMMTIVSEGFSTVAAMIESGQIDGVIGVACLDSLEKAFPLLIENAIPGIAIPLNKIGCENTSVDVEMVEKALKLDTDFRFTPIDIDVVKNEVQQWFSIEFIESLTGTPRGIAEKISAEWLAGSGNRWRPSLLAAIYQAISNNREFPLKVKIAAVATECFHKASLVHDDIEDHDDFRYGTETVHKKYGVAAAINSGDLLLGWGYNMLTNNEFTDTEKAKLIHVASVAHCDLCSGQGLDLEYHNRVEEIGTIINIARLKTVPAFAVAMDFGAILADASPRQRHLLKKYSDALGVAYQLKDDIEDVSYSPCLIDAIHKELDYFDKEITRVVREIDNPALRQLLFRLSTKMLGR